MNVSNVPISWIAWPGDAKAFRNGVNQIVLNDRLAIMFGVSPHATRPPQVDDKRNQRGYDVLRLVVEQYCFGREPKSVC